jgi:hypothetical protein
LVGHADPIQWALRSELNGLPSLVPHLALGPVRRMRRSSALTYPDGVDDESATTLFCVRFCLKECSVLYCGVTPDTSKA